MTSKDLEVKETPLARTREQSAIKGGSLTSWIDRRANVLYPLPSGIVLFMLFVLPIAYTVYLSFNAWGISATTPPRRIGLDNYTDLFANDRFQGAVIHTFYYSFLAVTIEVVLGIGIAMVFAREFIGRGVARTLFLFPMMATPIAAMIGWKLLLDPNTGFFNLLSTIGLPRFAPLADRTWVIPT